MLSDFLLKENIKVACITETHLVPSISSSFVSIPHFTLIRHDVPGPIQKHGVGVYVHNSVLVDSVDTPLPNLLILRLASFNVHVVLAYRPPSNSFVQNQQLASFLSHFCLDKEVVVLGDFNLPNVRWGETTTSHTLSFETTFLDTFDSLGLTQWVSEPTFPRSGNILDIVLSSEHDRISAIEVEPPLPGCDHCPIVFHYVFQTDLSDVDDDLSQAGAKRRAWHRGRYALINEQLSSIEWDLEFAHRDANDCESHFAKVLSDLTEQFIPVKETREYKVPWRTRPPTSLVHQRQLAWQKYKSVRLQLGRSASDTRAAYATFTSVNRHYRSFSIRSQADYEGSLIERSKETPKVLHSYPEQKDWTPLCWSSDTYLWRA